MNIANRDISDNIKMSRDFKGVWVPREIFLNRNINALEKFLWTEIYWLNDRSKGGCFATNEYLCKVLDVKERRLQEMLANLKNLSLIEYISFDGRRRIIRAIIPNEEIPDYEELQDDSPLRCGKMHPMGAEKCTPHIYIVNSLEEQQQAAAVSSKEISLKAIKIYPCLNEVDIPQKDKLEICKKHSEEVVKSALSWALHPKTVITKSLAAAIKWACDEKPKPPQSIEDQTAINKSYAKKYEGIKNADDDEVIANNLFVEITYRGCQKTQFTLNYDAKGFMDQFQNALRKQGFKIINPGELRFLKAKKE
jgi:hypothetical protein